LDVHRVENIDKLFFTIKDQNNDLLIASQARSLNAVLVTNNEREFLRVPDLTVENWM